MSISATHAAQELEQQIETVSPHRLIELMLEGAIERIDQAKHTLAEGQAEQAGELIGKAVGIVDGLKSNLDHDKGGDIADNLDRLYGYINQRLCEAEIDTGDAILTEASTLLSEVKSGWQSIKPL